MLLLQPELKLDPAKIHLTPTLYQDSTRCRSKGSDTYPQLRQMLEQVKYSSGKNELPVMCSSGMSPLKLSLKALRRGQTKLAPQHCYQVKHPPPPRHRYLESLVDDAGSTWRARGVVIQLLLQAAQQAAKVRRWVVGPSSAILDGAESFWKQTQLPETLLEKTVC